MTPIKSKPLVIRISLRWILLGMAVMVLLGAAGGFVGQQVTRGNTPLLPFNGRDALVTNVQQVTISPNQAIATALATTERSTVLLGTVQADGGVNVSGMGLIMTNDGLLVTSAPALRAPVAAMTAGGEVLPLEEAGADALYGLNYYRFKDAVSVPAPLANEGAVAGSRLTGLTRSTETFGRRTFAFTLQEYILPPEVAPAGIQRLMRGEGVDEEILPGSILVNEEGSVAGMLIDPQRGRALGADTLRASLSRVTGGRGESTVFTELGFVPGYRFVAVPMDTPEGRASNPAAAGPMAGKPARFVLLVRNVTANTPAARAGLRAGDMITRIGEQELTWDVPVLNLLEARSLLFTAIRQQQETQVTVVH